MHRHWWVSSWPTNSGFHLYILSPTFYQSFSNVIVYFDSTKLRNNEFTGLTRVPSTSMDWCSSEGTQSWHAFARSHHTKLARYSDELRIPVLLFICWYEEWHQRQRSVETRATISLLTLDLTNTRFTRLPPQIDRNSSNFTPFLNLHVIEPAPLLRWEENSYIQHNPSMHHVRRVVHSSLNWTSCPVLWRVSERIDKFNVHPIQLDKVKNVWAWARPLNHRTKYFRILSAWVGVNSYGQWIDDGNAKWQPSSTRSSELCLSLTMYFTIWLFQCGQQVCFAFPKKTGSMVLDGTRILFSFLLDCRERTNWALTICSATALSINNS